MKNLFCYNKESDGELIETLVQAQYVRIERIVSTGECTPKGEWYDQDEHEWVSLLEGEACVAYDDGREVKLQKGDTLLINAHQKHRVTFTSTTPPCVWIAVFYHS